MELEVTARSELSSLTIGQSVRRSLTLITPAIAIWMPETEVTPSASVRGRSIDGWSSTFRFVPTKMAGLSLSVGGEMGIPLSSESAVAVMPVLVRSWSSEPVSSVTRLRLITVMNTRWTSLNAPMGVTVTTSSSEMRLTTKKSLSATIIVSNLPVVAIELINRQITTSSRFILTVRVVIPAGNTRLASILRFDTQFTGGSEPCFILGSEIATTTLTLSAVWSTLSRTIKTSTVASR